MGVAEGRKKAKWQLRYTVVTPAFGDAAPGASLIGRAELKGLLLHNILQIKGLWPIALWERTASSLPFSFANLLLGRCIPSGDMPARWRKRTGFIFVCLLCDAEFLTA